MSDCVRVSMKIIHCYSFFDHFGSGMARRNRAAPLDTFLEVWLPKATALGMFLHRGLDDADDLDDFLHQHNLVIVIMRPNF